MPSSGSERAADLLALVSRTLPPLRGKKRLGLRVMRRVHAGGAVEGTWKGRMGDGTKLELPRQSLMTWATAFEGHYDEAFVRYTEQFIRPDTVVLDVGASLGLWSVQLGRAAASRGAKVWAFEPNPANTPWIRRNVELNGLADVVTVNELGLGDSAGSATLVSAEYGVGNGVIPPIARPRPGAEADSGGLEHFPARTIELARLDEIELPARVSFIKIDTEGYEAAFLRGASALIERDRPVIFGEFASFWLGRRGEDLRATLAPLGYDVAALTLRPLGRLTAERAVQEHHVDLHGTGELPQNLLLRPLPR